MSGLTNISDIEKFLSLLMQDIRTSQLAEDDGGTLEQLFTQWAVDILAEGGETENARIAYDEKALGTKKQHKINAYSISENYETVDLFITVFKGSDSVVRIGKDEIDQAIKRISNFFSKGMYKEYVNEIEEASPIYDFAHTLSNSKDLRENLVRVNAIVLTDGIYPTEFSETKQISGYPIYFRVVDINYLYNVTEKSHIPIEINFEEDGFEVPCIESNSDNQEYRSYLAIIPGMALASIYEKFGSRLLEQNVRSFLQFSGKINKGIRKTILGEPYMFLAYNNGLAATANHVDLSESRNGSGLIISKVNDFQIVNGGQTTASIYHTYKKDKADISNIYVQLKLTVIKNENKFNEIVSSISEYANTQNKVSVSDLSSNRPFHIELEKISRNTVTPHIPGKSQTYWFYERARGQYKTARLKEGFTKSRLKAFDIKYDKRQVFNKEELAKYINTYQEVAEGKKIVIGPYIVVRGNQKNYAQFINFNIEKDVSNIYFEDSIAKLLLFRTTEKIYGVKPYAIGDMRYITVPYSIAKLNYDINYKLDLYKIWKNQGISEELSGLLHKLMVKIENFIKTNAPGSLYGEWAKKEECWDAIKKQDFDLSYESIKNDFLGKNSTQRKRVSTNEAEELLIQQELEKINAIPYEIWRKIEEWGETGNHLTEYERSIAYNIGGRVRSNSKISDNERKTGINIINKVIDSSPEILFEIEDNDSVRKSFANEEDISIDTIKKIVHWDKKNRRLKDFEYIFMNELSSGNKPLTPKNKKIAILNLNKAKKYGFSE